MNVGHAMMHAIYFGIGFVSGVVTVIVVSAVFYDRITKDGGH